jgi:hypothetical protein
VICALLFPLSFARQRMCKGEHLSSFAASFFLRTLVKSFVVVFEVCGITRTFTTIRKAWRGSTRTVDVADTSSWHEIAVTCSTVSNGWCALGGSGCAFSFQNEWVSRSWPEFWVR